MSAPRVSSPPTSAPRIALLGMILESNRMSAPAGRADFDSLTWLEGEALLAEARSDTPVLAQEFAAFVCAMDATGPWQPVPCLLAASHPAGPVEESVFEEIVSRNETLLRNAGPLDAVYICNHGAMVATHEDDPDGALIERVRRVVGPDIPIIVTLDLHGNISRRMVLQSDLIVGYRTNPHVDMRERGEEAAFTLRLILASGQRPKASLVKPRISPASVTLLTANAPYGSLIDLGQRRQAEMRSEILNVSIFGNFIFADVPDNTISIIVTARSDRSVADALAAELAREAWARRHEFMRDLTSLEDATRLALQQDRRPIIFSDAGDNPGGGGSGRTTELLAALHAAGAQGVYYGSFADPELAAEAHALGQGASFSARFNRDLAEFPWQQWDVPFEAQATVLALHDGDVVGHKGMTAGRRMHIGPSALLEVGGIKVVVITDRTQSADPVFFEMMGLDVADARTVVVKSRGHFRAGFCDWFAPEQVYEVDTAGLTSPVLSRWPLKNVPRPTFPLDQDMEWQP